MHNFKMKYPLIILLIVMSSCSDKKKVVTYHHSETTITRIDKPGKSTFYYGDISSNQLGGITVEYSGWVSGFSGYLVFYDSGKVKLLSGDGNFQMEDIDTSLPYRLIEQIASLLNQSF